MGETRIYQFGTSRAENIEEALALQCSLTLGPLSLISVSSSHKTLSRKDEVPQSTFPTKHVQVY